MTTDKPQPCPECGGWMFPHTKGLLNFGELIVNKCAKCGHEEKVR